MRVAAREGLVLHLVDERIVVVERGALPHRDPHPTPGSDLGGAAVTRVDVPEASVSDAVMMLDLRNTNALLFKNSGTGAFNMVYRRGDGTIGWVEPQRAA